MSISREIFGEFQNQEVTLYTLDNGRIRAAITDFGGIITRLIVPDPDGRPADVVLGFDRLEEYFPGHLYFGALIGRCANRIDQGAFEINGHRYQLDRNENGRHHLHGGVSGFHRRLWDSRVEERNDGSHLVLELISPHLDEGYPGELRVKAVYSLTPDDALTLNLTAETDRPTIVNLTNHSYFNLAGHDRATIHPHELMIDADAVTVPDEELIPTGEERPVAHTPLDFRRFRPLGTAFDENGGPFDHNFILNHSPGIDKPAAVLRDPESGRMMKLYTTAPGLQFYTGQLIPANTKGKSNTTYGPYSGLCLEPQAPPNAVNIPSFPSVILQPGEIYTHAIRYCFKENPSQ